MDPKAGKVSKPTSNSKRATFFGGGVGPGDGVGVEVGVDAWLENQIIDQTLLKAYMTPDLCRPSKSFRLA